MKRRSFTLVEILVVIGTIAILMGILFPAVGMIRVKASQRQSQTEVKAIQTAIQSFKNEYHYLPDTTTGNDVVYFGSVAKATPNSSTDAGRKCADIFKEDTALQSDYIDLFSTICFQKPSGAVTDSDTAVKSLNPRGIKFLTPTKKYSKTAATEQGFRDPWGRPYMIFLDTNYDGKISLPTGCGLPDNTYYGDVAVIGLGSYDYEANGKISDALKKDAQVVTSWQ